MKNRIYLLILLLLFLTACNNKVTEEDLIGGAWIATAGYKDGDAQGKPNCHPFEEGIEFKNVDTVYNESFKENFTYFLSEIDKGTEIAFDLPGPGIYRFQIKLISEEEMVLEGVGLSEGRSCYLERQ